MTQDQPTDPEVLDASLPAVDQLRLRWLREDLTSCLSEVGAILRRVSGEVAVVPSFCIAIDAATAEADPAAPVTISWQGVDGAALTYDWRTGALRRQRPGDGQDPLPPAARSPDA